MTQFKKLFGVERPIIQAPMAGVQGSELAIAVCNAGGLGSLPCAMLDTPTLRAEITAIKQNTRAPFNVNFFCHTQPEAGALVQAAWLEVLAPYYDELEIDSAAIIVGGNRLPFNAAAAEVVTELKPEVVSFHFGLPDLHLLADIKNTGAKILSTATTLAEAKWLESRGVDAIIAQGIEAGGHRGHFLSDDLLSQKTTAVLVRELVEHLSVPIIAAGGIASSVEVAALLKLGAAGVQVGTAYLMCEECSTSLLHRAALKASPPLVSVITNLFTGRPARGMVNRVIQELGAMNNHVPPFPLAAAAIAPLRAQAEAQGCFDFSPLWAGQNLAGCSEISAAEMTRRLTNF